MTRCKNCMRTLALALTLVLSLSISVPARAAVDETNAHRLNALGLFLGTGSGYDLGGTATRLHGIIMLTRMLGEEADALSFDGPCPFSDVAAGKPGAYTGYAFAQGYTTGVSATTFNPGPPCCPALPASPPPPRCCALGWSFWALPPGRGF